ncbi:MAG: amidohydrolase family protein, partial [Candidatus Bathyarchaeia archaeon]
KVKEDPEIAETEWDQVLVVLAEERPELTGKSIEDIAKIQGKDPLNAVFDLLIEEEASVSIVKFAMCEEDVRRVMRSPYTMVGTDGRAVSPKGILGRGKVHPRFYGTFPRILGYYVRDEGVLTLQEAIRKMTSMPAQKIGLRDRGLLREGMVADIVIFDADEIRDEATFTDPHRFPRGIYYVIVDGETVVRKNRHTGALPGKALKKSDYVHKI